MTERSYQQLQIEHDLRQAVGSGDFELHYQPKIDLQTGRATGLEALLRWPHAGRGMVSPAEFIPVAEHNGLIHEIGDWVTRRACQQARAWQEQGSEPLRIAVNLSPVQLRSEDIVDRVQAILASTGLDPRYLEFEITESSFMHDIERSARTLHRLRNLGVHISLDDFGTGYSSLSYLKRLPVDSLKIDGSFISDMAADREGTVLVSAIIAMAQHLGIRVIAEGVETREQLQLLRELGCDEAQGYLVSRPLPVTDLESLLGSGTSWRFALETPGSAAIAAAGGGGNVVQMPKQRSKVAR
jgi:EAL domain-containing protein (putative c-di-GMP-specific phosphodiesterase class I)